MNIEQILGKFWIKISKYKIEINHQIYNRLTFNTIRITPNHLFPVVVQTPGYNFHMLGSIWFEPHWPIIEPKVWVLLHISSKPNHTLKQNGNQYNQGTGFLAWWFVCVTRIRKVPGSIPGNNKIFKTFSKQINQGWNDYSTPGLSKDLGPDPTRPGPSPVLLGQYLRPNRLGPLGFGPISFWPNFDFRPKLIN